MNTHIRDNLNALSIHAHSGVAGDGATLLNGLTEIVFTDAAAPTAPGVGLTALYTVAGVPHYRAGTAGPDTSLGGGGGGGGLTITAFASGTQSATVTTEHQLANVNVAGEFVFYVDCVNMVSGDALELRIYQIVLTGGVDRVIRLASFFGAQEASGVEKMSPMVLNELTDSTSLKFSLKQTAGTSRTFPWKVLKVT